MKIIKVEDILRSIIKKEIVNDEYGKYRKLIYDIKNEYKYVFKDDLKKIDQEKERIKLEIESSKTPSMGYMITIIAFIFTFLLRDIAYNLFMKISYSFAVYGCLVYVLIIIIVFGRIIVRSDYKLQGRIYMLKALEELEDEFKNEKNV